MFRVSSSFKILALWTVFLGVLSYLIYHLVEGRLGLKAWSALSVRSSDLAQRIEVLEGQERALKVRAGLMKGHVDQDLLEEQVVRHLGYARPGDAVFLDQKNHD